MFDGGPNWGMMGAVTSAVADPNLAAALDHLAAALDQVQAAGVDPVDSADALTVLREIEVSARRLRAVQVDVVAAADRRSLYRADGHASAKVMVRHAARLSGPEASRRASAAKALRHLPAVRDALAAGRIGACQAEAIARVYANRRVRARLCRQDDALAELAARWSYRDFEAKLAEWARLADEDGTADAAQRNHENRDARLAQDFDGGWSFTARCGSLQGAELASILERFVDGEFRADWDKARAEHGDAATVDDLPRTAAHRRFDGFFELFQRAAAAVAAAEGGSQIVTNIVLDQATFERWLRRFAGACAGVAEGDVDLDLSRPGRPSGYRCSTLNGHHIDPTEAVAQALVGHVRRAVVGADSVVTDLGRRRRLFTGAAQLAVKLASTECYWPGCHVPVTDCQVDHLIPWADHGGGSTSPRNGGPACGRHNRHKQRGYRVWRDAAGEWHILRPDGTELD